VNTAREIEKAVEGLAPAEQRKVLAFLSAKLTDAATCATSPNLKELLAEFPNVGTDADFARIRETPRDVDLS
jgi:hypothetical protein